MKTEAKLKIADIIIKMQSDFALQQFTEQEKKQQASERFDNFSYKGRTNPDIVIDIKIVEKLPDYSGDNIFITKHFQDNSENWRLFKRGASIVYKAIIESKKQVMVVNDDFDRVTAYLLPKQDKGLVWATSDIIYDFLQVLLINYFSKTKKGIFTHSVGIKDVNGNGLLFNGKSGAGKSTTARLWHNNTKAMVLNDDRIIVSKVKNKFFIHGSPWHGEFSDYLNSRIESAPLKNIFFIRHSKKNTADRICEKEAFSVLYPALFPTFWNKECLENIASFCLELIKEVPCYKLGFTKDEGVIDFVRSL